MLFFTSCQGQGSNSQGEQKEIDRMMNLTLIFYPTGVIEDVRYSIKIEGDSFIVRNHSPRDAEKLDTHNGKLSKEEKEKVQRLVQALEPEQKGSSEISEDTWSAKLTIDGKTYYEKSDFSLQKAKREYKELFEYLIKLSPVEIDLYGFS